MRGLLVSTSPFLDDSNLEVRSSLKILSIQTGYQPLFLSKFTKGLWIERGSLHRLVMIKRVGKRRHENNEMHPKS